MRTKSRAAMLPYRLLPVLLLLAMPARAEEIALAPPSTTVAIRFYGLGFLPIDGNYTRFHGRLTYDRTDRTRCQAKLIVDAGSLTMGNVVFRNRVVGPEFMDAARYPTLTFDGTCHGPAINGVLTMHGVTHALDLSLDWQGPGVVAPGTINRALWGMTAHPFLAGRIARIRIGLPLASDEFAPHQGATR